MASLSVAPATKPSTTDEHLEYLPLSYLLDHANPHNPKDHDIGEIVESIRRHGFVGAVTLDSASGILVAGHGRLKALLMLCRESDGEDVPDGIRDGEGNQGWLVPTLRKYFPSDIERDAYTIGDNQTTIKGGWHTDELTTMLRLIAEAEEDGLRGTGFDQEDLDFLLADAAPLDPQDELETYKVEQFGCSVRVNDRENEEELARLLEAKGYRVVRMSGYESAR